jgi:perosamine synthetase
MKPSIANAPLALFGGAPVLPQPRPAPPGVGEAEAQAAAEVVRGGVLSDYVGAPGPAFMGGARVRALETLAAEQFGARHALAVNSWTSGLICAVGALGLEPGDEVITTPWTMAATATAILHWNAIPVFADIDPTTFNIDPVQVERLISPRTRAIMAVDIFGLPADWDALSRLAQRHDLKLLGDSAQAPGALSGGRHCATRPHIGGYSLNYHKHIHCGEGGIIVTDDDRLARRMAMIRNHAECIVQGDDPVELAGMLGYNFRLGEIEAAIAALQLAKLPGRLQQYQRAAAQLNDGLRGLPGLQLPQVPAGSTHSYYVYGMQLDPAQTGVPREALAHALRAEGVPGVSASYQNLHRLPLFEQRIAYGTQGFPFRSPYARDGVRYGAGTCPVAERLHDQTYLGLAFGAFDLDEAQLDLMIEAFHKVWAARHTLVQRAA